MRPKSCLTQTLSTSTTSRGGPAIARMSGKSTQSLITQRHFKRKSLCCNTSDLTSKAPLSPSPMRRALRAWRQASVRLLTWSTLRSGCARDTRSCSVSQIKWSRSISKTTLRSCSPQRPRLSPTLTSVASAQHTHLAQLWTLLTWRWSSVLSTRRTS